MEVPIVGREGGWVKSDLLVFRCIYIRSPNGHGHTYIMQGDPERKVGKGGQKGAISSLYPQEWWTESDGKGATAVKRAQMCNL